MVLGFVGNALFSMRFLVQWIASERQGESVIPVSFWYWSIAGSVLMCVLLRLPSRPSRHSRIFAKFIDLHSQLDAHPKTQVRVHRRSAFPASTRGRVVINRAD